MVSSSSGRPRRSCATATKNYKVHDSPDKIPTKKRRQRLSSVSSDEDFIAEIQPKQSTKKYKISEESVTTIDCDITPTKKSNKDVKLASIFVKSLPKPSIDPCIQRARQEFLMSGIPEKMRIEMEQVKEFEDLFDLHFCCFPQISSVAEFKTDKLSLEKNQICVLEDIDFSVSNEVIKFLSRGKLTDCNKSIEEEKFLLPQSNKINCKLKSSLVRALKFEFERFPTFRCYKQIIKQNDVRSKIKSLKSNESLSMKRMKLLFTEKYKPNHSDDILFNKTPVNELKNFLCNWTNGSRGNSQDFDFENSSSSSISMMNAIVLIGPPGSGKTASVYALANELNFKILEINAGDKRNGKKMLQELQEATQSHNLRGKKGDNLNSARKTEIEIENDDDDISNLSIDQDEKLALIVIEDADIVFDEDDGFINAINQLIITSKRPVILVVNNSECTHLLKYISSNSITFDKLRPNYIAKYLTLISIMENVFLDTEQLIKLFNYNNCDFRKTLHEVQFYIESGGDKLYNCTSQMKGNLNKTADCTSSSGDDDDNDSNPSSSGGNSDTKMSLFDIQKHKNILDFYIKNQNNQEPISHPIDFNSLWRNKSSVLDSNKSNDVLTEFYDNISSSLCISDANKLFERPDNPTITNDIVYTIVFNSAIEFNSNFTGYTDLCDKNEKFNFEPM